jgi:proteasome lid subunit RPN8/RPN11
LNPDDNFDFEEEFDGIMAVNNINIFKKAFLKYPELKEVIWIGFYHCLNTLNFKHESLTVLNKNFDLIVDLLQGNDRNVVVPNSVKIEYQKGNVLATFHNHFNGAILPSINDFNNSILPKLNFTVITSENVLGIIVNDNDSLDSDSFQLLINDFKLFEVYLNFCFTKEEYFNLKNLKNNFSGDEFNKQREALFNNYIFKNLEKFVLEFNNRMEKYNVYYVYIKL